MFTLSDRTSLGWGLVFMRRWPALSLVKLLSLIAFFLYCGLDLATISEELPLILLVTAPIRAGYLHLFAGGLQDHDVTWRFFWQGLKKSGGPLVLLWAALYIITRALFLYQGFFWLLPLLLLSLELKVCFKGRLRHHSPSLVPALLYVWLGIIVNLLLTEASWWPLPVILLFYPWLATWLIASGVAGRLQGLDYPINLDTEQTSWAPRLRIALVCVALSIITWPFITGIYAHYQTFLPGHQPLLTLDGYRYTALDVTSYPDGPRQTAEASLVLDAFTEGQGGRGRIISPDRPTLFFTFGLESERKPFHPIIGLSGHRGGPMLLIKSRDLISLGHWSGDREPQLADPSHQTSFFGPLFVSIGDVYGVAAGYVGDGYYFAPELPTPDELRQRLLAAFFERDWGSPQPEVVAIRVGAALASPSDLQLTRLLPEADPGWPDRFRATQGPNQPFFTVNPIEDRTDDSFSFSGEVSRPDGTIWSFTGTAYWSGRTWRIDSLSF